MVLTFKTGQRLEYFTAKWCVPCRTYGPIVEEVTTQFQVSTEKIDIDESRERVPVDVMSVPTIIMYENDIEVSRIIGARRAEDLSRWLLNGGS